jgi:hypothetical protein
MSKNKTEVVITVTESHIKRGKIQDSNSCPVALALRSKKYRAVNVDDDSINFVNRSGRDVELDTPKKVSTFIERFDSGKKVKPFSFKLSY